MGSSRDWFSTAYHMTLSRHWFNPPVLCLHLISIIILVLCLCQALCVYYAIVITSVYVDHTLSLYVSHDLVFDFFLFLSYVVNLHPTLQKMSLVLCFSGCFGMVWRPYLNLPIRIKLSTHLNLRAPSQSVLFCRVHTVLEHGEKQHS